MRRLTFPHRMRLGHGRDFARAYAGQVRRAAGPLLVFAVPNALPHPRLGLSVSRRVGIAVRRNLIKRRLREAFRLNQDELPTGFDLVVVVRPHEPLPLKRYGELLKKAAAQLADKWRGKEGPLQEGVGGADSR